MRRKCMNCNSKVGETYRVNGDGDIFCDDDCYEVFMNENKNVPDDHNHPYIDDYAAIRFEYMEFLKFEQEIMSRRNGQNLMYKVDETLDRIDSVQWEFFDFYVREGDDGIFAHEIYAYYEKLEKLKEKILRWRPKREVFFYLKIKFEHGAFPEVIDTWIKFACLLKQMGLLRLYRMLKGNLYPDEEMTFYFYGYEDLNKVMKELPKHFNKGLIHLHVS
jgi:hypothetical protein